MDDDCHEFQGWTGERDLSRRFQEAQVSLCHCVVEFCQSAAVHEVDAEDCQDIVKGSSVDVLRQDVERKATKIDSFM